jgi:hypothetical protein
MAKRTVSVNRRLAMLEGFKDALVRGPLMQVQMNRSAVVWQFRIVLVLCLIHLVPLLIDAYKFYARLFN